MRSTIDFPPLYHSTIGFDRMASLLDSVTRDAKPGYPPYNIEQIDENQYCISMAVAGFSEADLDISSEQNTLVISSRQPQEGAERNYLHRRYCRAQLRAQVPVGRAREGGLRPFRARSAACGPGARSARGHAAAQDTDRRRQRRSARAGAGAGAGAKAKRGLNPRPRLVKICRLLWRHFFAPILLPCAVGLALSGRCKLCALSNTGL